MDEVHQIVGPRGPYLKKVLYVARKTLEASLYQKSGQRIKNLMMKCGLYQSYMNEVDASFYTDLDNPAFRQCPMRFDAEVPESLIRSSTDASSSKQETKSKTTSSHKASCSSESVGCSSHSNTACSHKDFRAGSSSSSQCLGDADFIFVDSSSSEHQDNDDILIIDSSSLDSDRGGDRKIVKLNSTIEISSDNSLDTSVDAKEDGELSDESDMSEEDRESQEQYCYEIGSKVNDNENFIIHNRKRKFSRRDFVNGNVIENDNYFQNGYGADCNLNDTDVNGMNSVNGCDEMVCFQCELCGMMNPNEKKMMEHLVNAVHFSASKVRGEFVQGNITSIYVVKESWVTNSSAKYKTLVPICPECFQIFPTIYDCALHFTNGHNRSVTDCYSLGRVTREMECLMKSDKKCQECNKSFNSPKQLLMHWNSCDHLPFWQPDINEIMFFFCQYCESHSNDFESSYNHNCISQSDVSCNSDKWFTVRYIEKSTNCLKLLPSIHCLQVYHDQQVSHVKRKKSKKRKKIVGNNNVNVGKKNFEKFKAQQGQW